MERTASIVIIGGGIVGCGAALYLSRLGWQDIVVLEQGPLFKAGGSTSHAPGIHFHTGGSRMMTEFGRETIQLVSSLDYEGEPCFYQVGSMEVAVTPERWEDLKRKLGWAKSWGEEACLLSPDQAREKLPFLDATKILGAYYVPSDGVTKAVQACAAMANLAKPHAEFYERTPVTGIEVERGRVRGVVTPAGRIATDRVLICAGIWGPKVGKLAGVSIPLIPVEHQLAWTTPLPELAGETRWGCYPVLRHQDRDMYFRQRLDHFAVGSYQHDPVLVEAEAIRPHGQPDDMPASNPFDAAAFEPAWQEALSLIPALRQTQIAEAYNGMFSFTPDGFPLIGEAADVRGCWVAEAIWIMHAGGAARAVAELLTSGKAWVDLREADLNRFEPHVHSPAYVRARGRTHYIEVYDIIHPLQPMEEPRPLRKSPFYEQERQLGAAFFEARGWEQPRWYEANAPLLDMYHPRGRTGWAARYWSPIAGAEHLATRERVALFDMTPLPKLEVSGPGALAFLQCMTTNQLDRPAGSVVYTLMLDEAGGIRSDMAIARLAEDRFQIGCNGPLDFHWLRRHLPEDGSVYLRDVTGALCCTGLWGPRARDVLRTLTGTDLSNEAFPYFSARQIFVGEVPVTALRVSYVGELGWELYAPAEYGGRLWDLLWQAGQPHGIIAAGRAAFDALRIEKGYRLWGADMHTEYNPYEAGLGFAVKLDKGNFIGRDACLRTKERVTRRLCCLVLDNPDVVVMGKEPVLSGNRVLGYVTSAAFGYSVGESIAYSYLPVECAAEGTPVEIEYFGERCSARVAKEPRFDPERKRLKS